MKRILSFFGRPAWTLALLVFGVGACSSVLGYDDVSFGSGTFGPPPDAGSEAGTSGGAGMSGSAGTSGSAGMFSDGGPGDAAGDAGGVGGAGGTGAGGTSGFAGAGGTGVGGASGFAGSGGGTPDPYTCGNIPPIGAYSTGDGGQAPVNGIAVSVTGASTYRLVVPSNYSSLKPIPLLVVISGTEGASAMLNNVTGNAATAFHIDKMIRAVIDGTLSLDAAVATAAGAIADIRSKYQVDNDRTYLLSESAGTGAGLTLGFAACQEHFAAFWVNDVNTSSPGPAKNATALQFQPWGQVGPGSQFAIANTIIDAMKAAGYRTPSPAPYSGPGAGDHGSTAQFASACQWFAGKSR